MKNFKVPISSECKRLLSKAEFNSVLHLPKMTDAEYDNIKYIVEYMGGHWRERYSGFVFDDSNEHIQSKLSLLAGLSEITIDPITKFRIDNQFYPTPDWLAIQMVEAANIMPSDYVLEPSAGKAAILKYIADKTPKYTAVELNSNNTKWLRTHGYRVNQMSFETYYKNNNGKLFDKVVMNPPFSEKRDLIHTIMAYNLLKPGGILVGLVAENSLYYNRPITRNFINFFKSVGGVTREVPHGTFKESGTLVDIAMLIIPKVDGKIYSI